MNRYDILRKAIEAYGIDIQLDILQEECAELIQAVSKYKRYGKEDGLFEEMADVLIMIEQMQIFFGNDEVERQRQKKTERLAERLENK